MHEFRPANTCKGADSDAFQYLSRNIQLRRRCADGVIVLDITREVLHSLLRLLLAVVTCLVKKRSRRIVSRGIKLEVQDPRAIGRILGDYLSPFPLVNLAQKDHRYVDSVCFRCEAKTTGMEYSDALPTFYLL